MDYSLYLVVEKIIDDIDYKSIDRNIFISKDETEVYHIGVIDYL